MTKKSIVIVEDDAHLRFGIEFNLKKEGYDVRAVGSAEDAAKAIAERAPDLAIFDIMLPGKNGLELLGDLRGSGREFPVVMLTARADEADAVTALSLGADDYVRKPFGLAELLMRIAAILRRTHPGGGERAQTGQTPSRDQLGEWRLDLEHVRAVSPSGEVTLTTLECEILRVLMDAFGTVVRREDLLQKIWGLDNRALTRTLDNHVARLRKKLEIDPQNPRHLLTVHGVGYKAT